MRYILWAQNESTSKKPTIIVDDEIITDPTQVENAFQCLCNKNENLFLSPETREKIVKKNDRYYKALTKKYKQSFNSSIFAHSTNYAVMDDGIYLQGCFIETDVRSRLMPYMFFCQNTTSIEEAINQLNHAASLISRHCNTFELTLIKDTYHTLTSRQNKKKRLIIGLGIIFLLLIILFLFKI